MCPTYLRASVMFRSALAWTLTTAFLVTVPVTGAGYCPCRLVKAPGKTATTPVAQTTAPQQARKGCCQGRHDMTPERTGGERQTPSCPRDGPADAPCDHKLVADAAPTGERSDARGVWDAGPPTWGQPTTHLAHAPAVAPDRPIPAPSVGRDSLRYAHAFRS